MTVTSEITKNVTWTSSESPYIVSGMIVLDKGAVLTIEPGVVVKFNQNAGITVNGSLVASGTPSSPIYFTSFADDKIGGDTNKDKSASVPAASDQWSINFINASSSSISNSVIRYSAAGFFVLNSSVSFANTRFSIMNGQISIDQGTLSVRDSSFSGMNRGAITVFGTSTSFISSSTIDKSTTDAVDVFGNSTLQADGLSVTGETGGAGLLVFNSSAASCSHCLFSGISNNSGASVSVFSESSLSLDNSSINDATGTNPIAVELFDTADSGSSGNRHSQLSLSNTVIKESVNPGDTTSNGIQAFGPVTLNAGTVAISGFGNDGVVAYNNATINLITSTISKNKNAGIEVYGVVSGSVVDSVISGNGKYGIMSQTNTPFSATNNWWGGASGPYHQSLNPKGSGNAVSDNVAFSPWLRSQNTRINPDPLETQDTSASGSSTVTTTDPPCCSNILFLPGMEASRLYIQNSSGIEQQLWEPNNPTDAQSEIRQLFLDAGGASMHSIYTKDIVDQVDLSLLNVNIYHSDIYKGFSDSLNGLVASGTITAWKSYPYDWRLDSEDLVKDGTQLSEGVSKILPVLESLVSTSKTHKVTIVAHSNGGLIAKALMQELQAEGKEDLVDTLILVAVPQLGTPVAIPALLSGYGQSIGFGFILDSANAQLLAENMPTAYSLLPSSAYFAKNNSPVLFDQSLNSISNLYKVYGPEITNYTSFTHFLSGVNDQRPVDEPLLAISNGTLLAQAKNLHDSIDTWQVPPALRVFQIAGTGIDTLSATRYYAKNLPCIDLLCQSTQILDMEPVMTSHGDSTVISSSATAIHVNASTTTFYVDLRGYNSASNQNRSHTDILEALPTQQIITAIIQENPLYLPRFVSTSSPIAANDEQISVHSPVDINIYDNQNRHTGPIAVTVGSSTVTTVETQIPNSYYLPFGEGTYVGVPLGTTGNVILSGTAIGTFTLDIKTNATTTEFSDVPILPVSVGTLSLDSNKPILSIDFDGDGTIDSSFSPTSSFNPISYLGSMKKIINSFTISPLVKSALKDRIDRVIRTLKIDNIPAAQKIILRYMKRPYTPRKNPLKGALSADDQETIVSMLSQVLNELGN